MSDNELEHWSSPDGCHEGCPACEAEAFPKEDWEYDVANGDTKLGYKEWREHNIESAAHEHAAKERLERAAPELLAALQALMADLEDVEDDRNPETGEVFSACIQAREAIAKAKGEKL